MTSASTKNLTLQAAHFFVAPRFKQGGQISKDASSTDSGAVGSKFIMLSDVSCDVCTHK